MNAAARQLAEHVVAPTSAPIAPEPCADCVASPCQCARRAMLRVAGRNLRLDKLNGELSAAISRLQKVVDPDEP